MFYRYENKPINLDLVTSFHKELNLPFLVGALLTTRGGLDLESVLTILDSKENLFDPFLLKGMKFACSRITLAMKKKEKIFICGDYDVDGITSTCILLRFFDKIGFPVNFFLPSQSDGHGLSVEMVKKIKELGGKLIITVDNGSSSYEAIDLAKELGVDVIITDHHDLSSQGVPKAYAVVNPKQPGCTSPFPYLSGGGLAFYLARALASKLPDGEKLISDDLYTLATISTIADVAPLYADNRIIVKRGLKDFTKTEILGLKLLLEGSGSIHSFSARDVSFKIAPIINAAGKLGFAADAISLLTETNFAVVSDVVEKLQKLNSSRRDQVQDLLPDLISKAKECVKNKDHIIVVDGNHNSAFNGIIASQLAEQFQKPIIVISFRDGDIGRGSCRSIDGFNFQQAIEDLSSFHSGGGGHYMAAGVSVSKDQFPTFKMELNKYAESALAKKTEKIWQIDAEVTEDAFKQKMIKYLYKIAPFGAKNEAPLLKIRNIRIDKNPERRFGYYSKFGELSFPVIKGTEPSMGDLPLNKFIHVIAELNFQGDNPMLIVKDFEIAD